MKWKKRLLIGICAGVILWCVSWALLYAMGFRVYKLPVQHMAPTIGTNDYTVGRLSADYRMRIQRNEIVLFRFGAERETALRTKIGGSGTVYAHRVVGLPGDELAVSEHGVFVNGRELGTPNGPVVSMHPVHRMTSVLPTSTYFVIGDNPKVSMDSRHFGVISAEEIVGRVLFVD